MTANSRQFLDYVLEQLADIGEIEAKRFFGGTGLYSNHALFAMLMQNRLYFLVDDAARERYQRMGSQCFSYASKKGRVDVTRYYEVPADLFDDAQRLQEFARDALRIARVTKTSRPKRLGSTHKKDESRAKRR